MTSNKKLSLPSEEELDKITTTLGDLDQTVAISMSHVRRIQGWSIEELYGRFSSLPKTTIQKYLQPSYQGIRPIHFIAAYSWVTMVLMTSFLRGFKITEPERGVDSEAIEAIIQCGRLPKKLYQSTLDIIFEHLSNEDKEKYLHALKDVTQKYGSLNDYDDDQFLPPSVIDINDFGDDYYYSLALAFHDFENNNNLSIHQVAKGLGLSIHRYKILRDPDKGCLNAPFDLRIGIRVRQVFHNYSHVEFTKYMKAYPQFHGLRIVQHIRDTLLVEGLRRVPKMYKASIINIMKEMSKNFTNKDIKQI